MNNNTYAITFYENNRKKAEFSPYSLMADDRKVSKMRLLKPFSIIRMGESLIPVFSEGRKKTKYFSRRSLEIVTGGEILPMEDSLFYNLTESLEILCTSRAVNSCRVKEIVSSIQKLYLLGDGVYLTYGTNFGDDFVDVMQELDAWSMATGFFRWQVIGMLEHFYKIHVVREAFENDKKPISPIAYKNGSCNIGKVGQLSSGSVLGKLLSAKEKL
jgi:hypothetical protein